MSGIAGHGGLRSRVVAPFVIGTGVLRFVWSHPANSRQRVRAVLRAIRYQAQVRLLRRRAMARLGERSRLWVDPHRTAASKVIYANPPDLPEMLVWRRTLREGSLFVDIGANVGSYTIWAAELGAAVIALEPAADTFALLEENIALNGYPVQAIQAAAGDHCGTARFTKGLDSVNRLAADGEVTADLVTVDSLLGNRQVAGMKVDVEGFEIDVLRGAADALAGQRIGLIQIEWNDMSKSAVGTDRRPLAALLASYGYRLYRPDQKGCLVELADPGSGADVFARPAPLPPTARSMMPPLPACLRRICPRLTPLSFRAHQESRHASRARLPGQRTTGTVFRTAFFNAAAAGSAAIGGLILARTVGPVVRGEYSAVTAWFGVLLIAGELGMSAAVCYYVASDPRHARSYVATARALMLITGTAMLTCGLLLAPLLAHGIPGLALAYRLAFAAAIIAFAGAGYTFSLQARNISRWNQVRLCQPLLALIGTAALWQFHLLNLHTAILCLIATMAVQLLYAYYCCLRCGLAPGYFRLALVRPLLHYGLRQLTAVAPVTVNTYLDQLVLSQVVPPASLGCYSVAVSVTLVPIPLVSAIGNVAFPGLARGGGTSAGSDRLARTAILASAITASVLLLPIAAIAYWLVPTVFGPAYGDAVPLVWLLTPGGVCLACGQVAGDLLRGLGRPGLVARAQSLAAVFTVILLIALVPVAGVAAAAIASTVAYGVALAVMMRFLFRPAARASPVGPGQQQESAE
jgi:FkbM family methyltransferase